VNELERFEFPITGQAVRTIDAAGSPWFLAADVTAILGYKNGRDAVAALPDRMRNTVAISDGTPGNPNRAFVNEAGVYRLVMRSNLPAAEAFQDWLAEEVIPAIRQTGSYSVPAPRTELSRRDLAVMVIAEADRADAAEAQVAVLAPAAENWSVLASAEGDYAVADAAKILSRDPDIQVGRDRLFNKLGDLGWAFRQRGDSKWRADQKKGIETGRLSELPQSYYHPRTGQLVLDAPQLRVTTKGLGELHRLLGGSVRLAITDSEGL
jgi:prophage antirepressor-like protein